MKIGFYGDSYCAKPLTQGHNTYMDIISDNLNAQIVNTGFGGSSIWDILLNQFDRDNVPDVSIFFWSNSSRLYHPVYRDISAKLFFSDIDNAELHEALNYYYTHLHHYEKMKLETTAALYWFDREILSKISKHKKIIHIWSIGERDIRSDFSWPENKFHTPDKIKYFYRWKTGVEIRPALFPLSLQGNTVEQNAAYMSYETRLNHLEEPKHQILVSWIEQALDQYQDGLLLDFSNDIKL